MYVKGLSLKIWVEISITCFVLHTAVMAQCDSGYVEINGNCYWEQDFQFFEDLENNSYRIQPHAFTDVSNYKFN